MRKNPKTLSLIIAVFLYFTLAAVLAIAFLYLRNVLSGFIRENPDINWSSFSASLQQLQLIGAVLLASAALLVFFRFRAAAKAVSNRQVPAEDRAGIQQPLVKQAVKGEAVDQGREDSFDLYASLIEHSPVSMLVVQGGALQFSNKALSQMLGYSGSELSSMPLENIFVDSDRKVVIGMYTLRMAGRNPPYSYEARIQCKDGSSRVVEVLASLIEYKGKPADLVMLRDITEKKKLEDELKRARDHAELSNRQKSRFFASISHEIRNPMNAIIGFTDLLKGSELNNLQKRYLDIISESGQMIIAVINDILDISKIEAGKIQLETIDFNLEYLIDSAIKIVSPRLNREMVELVYDYPQSLPRNFRGDPGRLRQILVNLLGNAAKFTEKGGIFISVSSPEPQELLSQDGTHFMRISVRDTGIGIPKDKLTDIFDAFSQKEASVAREYGGTGLGLYICRNMVELMGGEISVSSEEGKGSEFVFSVKLFKIDPAIDREASSAATDLLKDKKVLIIEEGRDVLNLLEQYCQNAGMQVCSKAPSIKDGLEWLCFQSELPDAVICALKSRNPEGYAFAKVLKRESRYKKIKLVALVMDADAGTARLLQDAGFDGYLPKPVTRTDLIQVMHLLFGEKRRSIEIITRHMAQEAILKGLRALIVDDNSINVKLLQNVLHSFGCQTESASNGKEAISLLGSRSFDVIFMDVNMPVMDGVEATRFIRSRMDRDIPIIALSGSATEPARERVIDAGMTDLLAKPITLAQLKEMFVKIKLIRS